MPVRSFCLSILSTLRHEELKVLIQEARKHRSLTSETDDNNKIEMTPNIKDALFSILLQKSK